MSVLKKKRQESQFEVFHHYYVMRRNLTELMMNKFGFSDAKLEKKLSKGFKGKSVNELTDEELKAYNRYRDKLIGYSEYFIPEERDAINKMLRKMCGYIHRANSIYPYYISELEQRRLYQDKAIGLCESLKQELKYTIETLPVDINKYNHVEEMIDKEIALIKGWRKADNKFLDAIAEADARRELKMEKKKNEELERLKKEEAEKLKENNLE